jgi:hypothetical protein
MRTPTEPITITISHRLGRDAAKQRIDSGLGTLRAELLPFVTKAEYAWDGYRLDFRIAAAMQTIVGRIEVYDEFVKVELGLPRLLHLLARTLKTRIEQRGAHLLAPPPGKP